MLNISGFASPIRHSLPQRTFRRLGSLKTHSCPWGSAEKPTLRASKALPPYYFVSCYYIHDGEDRRILTLLASDFPRRDLRPAYGSNTCNLHHSILTKSLPRGGKAPRIRVRLLRGISGQLTAGDGQAASKPR